MAFKKNLSMDQGATFSNSFFIPDANNNPISLSGYSNGVSQIKQWYTSNTFVSFTVSISNNNINLSLNANATANIASGKYVYDVIVNDSSNNIIRLAQGIIIVNPAV